MLAKNNTWPVVENIFVQSRLLKKGNQTALIGLVYLGIERGHEHFLSLHRYGFVENFPHNNTGMIDNLFHVRYIFGDLFGEAHPGAGRFSSTFCPVFAVPARRYPYVHEPQLIAVLGESGIAIGRARRVNAERIRQHRFGHEDMFDYPVFRKDPVPGRHLLEWGGKLHDCRAVQHFRLAVDKELAVFVTNGANARGDHEIVYR